MSFIFAKHKTCETPTMYMRIRRNDTSQWKFCKIFMMKHWIRIFLEREFQPYLKSNCNVNNFRRCFHHLKDSSRRTQHFLRLKFKSYLWNESHSCTGMYSTNLCDLICILAIYQINKSQKCIYTMSRYTIGTHIAKLMILKLI